MVSRNVHRSMARVLSRAAVFMLGLLVAGDLVPARALGAGLAQVTIDSAAMTNGYMNVFELPSNGGGYVFGSGWGVADLSATFPTSTTVNFTPSFVNDTNPFWYTPSGGPGASGNKTMEANLYAQPSDGTYSGQTLNFKGDVTGYTLVSGWTFKAFIRDFASDYSSVVETSSPISSTGSFDLLMATINDPARHIQYGLQMTGPCVWTTDIASKGSVTVAAPVPEPSSLALLVAGGGVLACVAGRRRGARRA